MTSKIEGTVKWSNNAKGYGFAVNEAGEDVFIHNRSIGVWDSRHWQKASRLPLFM